MLGCRWLPCFRAAPSRVSTQSDAKRWSDTSCGLVSAGRLPLCAAAATTTRLPYRHLRQPILFRAEPDVEALTRHCAGCAWTGRLLAIGWVITWPRSGVAASSPLLPPAARARPIPNNGGGRSHKLDRASPRTIDFSRRSAGTWTRFGCTAPAKRTVRWSAFAQARSKGSHAEGAVPPAN
jgi:hypothetical protein